MRVRNKGECVLLLVKTVGGETVGGETMAFSLRTDGAAVSDKTSRMRKWLASGVCANADARC